MTVTVRCPCCDQMMEVEPRPPRATWKASQIMAIRRMRANGIPTKIIARLFGVTDDIIIELGRHSPRVIIPDVADQGREAA